MYASRIKICQTKDLRCVSVLKNVSKKRYSTPLSEVEKEYYEKRESFPFNNTSLFNRLDMLEKKKMFGTELDIVNAICDFSKEEHLILDGVQIMSEDTFTELSHKYYEERDAGSVSSFSMDDIISLFYYCLKHNLSGQAMVFYYQLRDMPGIPQTEKIIGLFTLMALQEGKNEEPNVLVLQDVYKTIKGYSWYVFSVVDITVFMKAFAKIGKVQECLELWEMLYQINTLPEPQHNLSMLLGSSFGGDPKVMSRFYQRMLRKGQRPEKFLLKMLIGNWGKYHDLQWLRKKEANISVDDVCWTVDYALRVHNYKIAYDMVLDISNLSQPASSQLYEIFLTAIIRDLPYYRKEAKDQLKNLRRITNVTSKVRIDKFNNLVQRILDEFGEDAQDLPQQEKPTMPEKLSLTRKQRSMKFKSDGQRKPRFEPEKTLTFEELFIYEPKYLQRLADWQKEEELYQKKEEDFSTIDETIQKNLEKELKLQKLD